MINWLKSLFTPKPAPEVVTLDELKTELTSDAAPLVIDVRSAQEYGFHGHIAGAALLPLGELKTRIAEIPADRPVVLVCRTANRSGRAAQVLMAQNYTNIRVLDGGMQAWKKAGLPVETNPV